MTRLLLAVAALIAVAGCAAPRQTCQTTSAGIACVMEARP